MPAPPISALEQVANLDQTLVDRVRASFLENVQKNSQSFDDEDVEQVRDNRWQTQRFVLEAKLDAAKALDAMLSAFKWRSINHVRHLRFDHFPAIFYETGYMCRVGRDIHGAQVLYFRANIHRKTADWKETMSKFFLLLIEHVDANNDGRGVALFMNCSGIGYANLDLDMLRFVVETFSKYYPKLFDAIFVHELPFVLSYVFKLVQSWLPADDRKFFRTTTNKNIQQFIARDQLASFVAGGENDAWNILPSDNILTVEEFVHSNNLPLACVEKLSFLRQYIVG